MLAVPRSPMTSHESSLIAVSSLGTRWARNHCCPSRSASRAGTMTQRDIELPEPQPKLPETRKPPSASAEVALGNNVDQQPTGPLPNNSLRALAEAPLWMKALTALQIAMFQPAEPSAREISSAASNTSTPVPPRP